MRRGRSSGVRARRSASTAASSIAIAAPCARNGSIGWAASPSSVTGPSPQRLQRRQVVERPLLPALRQPPATSRGRLRPAPAARSAPSTSSRVAGSLQPGSVQRVVDDGDDVDQRAAPSPDSGRDARSWPSQSWTVGARNSGVDRGRPGSARARRCAGANCGLSRWPSRGRSADHRPSAPISAMPCSSAARRRCRQATLTPLRVHDEVLDPRAELEARCRDWPRTASSSAACRSPRWIDPVGRAVASLGVVAERNARERAAASRS